MSALLFRAPFRQFFSRTAYLFVLVAVAFLSASRGLLAADDSAASVFGITQPVTDNGTTHSDFVTLDPVSGVATVQRVLTANASQLFQKPGVDAVDSAGNRFFVTLHEDAGNQLLTLDATSGAELNRAALDIPLAHLGFNSTTGTLFGITQGNSTASSNFVHINFQSGLITPLTEVGSAEVGQFKQEGVDATDPSSNRFFVVRNNSRGKQLLTLDTETGVLRNAVQFDKSRSVLHMGFSTTLDTLFAIMSAESEGITYFPRLVSIDPLSGVMNNIKVIADSTQSFQQPGVEAVDAVHSKLYAIRTGADGKSLLTINMLTGEVENSAITSVGLNHIGAAVVRALPLLSVPTNITGVVGLPFIFEITATGVPPPVILANLLPQGQIISEQISGNTTTALIQFTGLATGIFSFEVFAQNDVGTTSATLGVTINLVPSFINPSFVTAQLNSLMFFPLSTNGNATLFETSALPAGLSLNGSVIQGAPEQIGSFDVQLRAQTDAGLANQVLRIVVNSAAVVNEEPVQALGISAASINLNFSAPGRDRILLSGALDVPRGFVIAGQNVSLNINGIALTFALDAKGSARTSNSSFSLRSKGKAGADGSHRASFSARFNNGDFATVLSPILENADVKHGTRAAHVVFKISGTALEADVPLIYDARRQKSGRAKTP